jgi:hypothetical protein
MVVLLSLVGKIAQDLLVIQQEIFNISLLLKSYSVVDNCSPLKVGLGVIRMQLLSLRMSRVWVPSSTKLKANI